MRCVCCDVILTPQESVRKFKESGEFTDTCNSCLKYIDVPTKEGNAFEEQDNDENIVDQSYDDNDLDEE